MTPSRLPLLLCTVLVLLAVTTEALAQVNTESMRRVDVDGFTLRLSGNLAFQQGNSDVFETDVAGRVDYRVRRHYTFLNASQRFARSDGGTFRNRAFAHVRYNYEATGRVTGEVFTQIERDAFTRRRVRLLGGLGPRIRYAQTDRWHLFQGSTLMHEFESLDPTQAGDRDPDTNRVRWSNYVNLRVSLNDQVDASATVYAQPWLSDFSNIRILHEALLSFRITRHLSFQTAFNLRYDSRPPAEVEDLDIALRQGFVFTL